MGEQATNVEQQFKATFSVPYSPGMLKAVGVEKDKEVESTILKTSGEAASIKLTTDRKGIIANGQDLSFVTIEICDKDGAFQPNAANRLQFKIEGPGTIAAVGNADMKDNDPYIGNSRKAWRGRAMVAIRSTHNAGDINLKVSSPGLSETSILVNAIAHDGTK
jgi:beta-galactosidase